MARRGSSVLDDLDSAVWSVDVSKHKSALNAGRGVHVTVTHLPSGRSLEGSAHGQLSKSDLSRHVDRIVTSLVKQLRP